jgi:hypothetical protein
MSPGGFKFNVPWGISRDASEPFVNVTRQCVQS